MISKSSIKDVIDVEKSEYRSDTMLGVICRDNCDIINELINSLEDDSFDVLLDGLSLEDLEAAKHFLLKRFNDDKKIEYFQLIKYENDNVVKKTNFKTNEELVKEIVVVSADLDIGNLNVISYRSSRLLTDLNNYNELFKGDDNVK